MDMTPHFPIYLDYGATTPVDPRVVDAMIPWLREHFGNPASRSHAWGWEAEEAVEKARVQVADLIVKSAQARHESRGLPLIRRMGERLRVPRAWQELALLVGEFHLECHRASELRPDTLLRKLEALDAWRRPERFAEFLLACEADARGRTGLEDRDYWQRCYWQGAADAGVIDVRTLVSQGLQGQAMAEAIWAAASTD